jgi:hypothetical protein
MEKSVVDAPVFEVEPMEKRRFDAMLVVDAACMEKSAAGEDEPTPTLPLKRARPPTFSVEEMVDEPVTVRAEVVAEVMVRKPPFTALKTPPMVVDAVTAKVPVEVAPVVVSPPLKARSVEVALLGKRYAKRFAEVR